MPVRLDESRQHAPVTDVDGLGVGADELGDLVASADGDDAAVGDGQCLCGGSGVVDGQDGSGNDEICQRHG